MPEVVEREPVVRRPVRLAGQQELDALFDAALHLHDMNGGVDRPAVARLHRQRARAVASASGYWFISSSPNACMPSTYE